MPEKIVREYKKSDRDAVRKICYETGFMGESAQWYWEDEKSFSDMWSGYYTDCEPENLFVAEIDGRVVGYLLGCIDSGKAWNPVSVGIKHAILRGCLIRPGTRNVMVRTIGDTLVEMITTRSIPVTGTFHDKRWPSHLHIDFLPEARGLGLGRKIMEKWLTKLRELSSPGCHLETVYENTKAIGYFRAMGFELFGEPTLLPGIRAREGTRLHGQVLVQSL